MTLIRAMRLVLMAEAAAGEAGGGAGSGAGVSTVLGGEGAGATQSAGGVAGQQGAAGAAGAGAGDQAAGGSGADGTAGAAAGGAAVESGAASGDAETGGDAQGAALEYADFSVPEGVTLNPELLGEFKGVAQAMGLKQEQAQQLTDLGVKLTQGLLAQQAQALETQKTAWFNETKADAEIGGDKFDASMTAAARAVKQFVPDELKLLFDQTGIGNHPDLVKAFVKIGSMLKEDGVVAGSSRLGGATGDARLMYPNSPGLK